MAFEILVIIALIAFILQFSDASIGQGYGEIAPILLLLGFATLDVVAAIILTSAILSLTAGILHHSFRNVDFSFKSKDFHVTLILTIIGIIGILIGVLVALNIPDIYLRSYIGILVIIMGIYLLFRHKRRHKFSWPKLLGFASLASFNKGMTGGGFGPVLASGQIVSGIKPRSSVGITALVEGVISFVGIGMLLTFKGFSVINLPLVVALLIGGLIATPIATYVITKFNPERMKFIMGIAGIILGTIIIVQVVL